MMKTLIFFFATSLCVFRLTAQENTDSFSFTPPEKKISESLYNKITLIDGRRDTSFMGIAQTGMLNRKARVIPDPAISVQVNNLFRVLIDNTAKEGELVLHIREFSFAELTGSMSEKGYCYLQAGLYSKRDNMLGQLATIDTVVLVKAMDVTKKMYRAGSSVLTDFIAKNLTITASKSTLYTYDEVARIDSIEKQTLKLYSSATLTDGLYKSYNSFRDQKPDETDVICDIDNNDIRIKDGKGKSVKPKPKEVYAIVCNRTAYIATDYGFYPLTKQHGDFFFNGKVKSTANSGDVIAASVFFGAIGGLIASNSATSTYEIKIDHLSGGFIQMKEIKNVGQPDSVY
ncbi:hypothetical protein [Arcticibacter tournemirensis]|uniref:Uncharacterized protein n=1 Tax=Arcticibacter tournemirensis TaxID=699437 RepID=A0A4Q0M6U3_9SPHI|nr:hypothetical protein [Arcticibacter tournemirensis]RXF68406.1 hypothetical protein EKH83_16120 [Arcticibacter tournemirensis]